MVSVTKWRKMMMPVLLLLMIFIIALPANADLTAETRKGIVFTPVDEEQEIPDDPDEPRPPRPRPPRPPAENKPKPNLPQTGQTTFHVLPIVGILMMGGIASIYFYQLSKVEHK